jgi:ribosomal protein S27AE
MNLVAKACHFNTFNFYVLDGDNQPIKIFCSEVEKLLNFYRDFENKNKNEINTDLSLKLMDIYIVGIKKKKNNKISELQELNKLFYDILHTNFLECENILSFYKKHGLLLNQSLNKLINPLESKKEVGYDHLLTFLENTKQIKQIEQFMKAQSDISKTGKKANYSPAIRVLNQEIKKIEPKIVIDNKGAVIEEKHSQNLMNAVYYYLVDSLKKSKEMRNCKYCGREFIAENGNELYCPPLSTTSSRSECEHDYNYRKRYWGNKVKSGKYTVKEAAAKITWRNKNGDLEKGISVEKMKELLNDSK